VSENGLNEVQSRVLNIKHELNGASEMATAAYYSGGAYYERRMHEYLREAVEALGYEMVKKPDAEGGSDGD
jgi:hypothetical protein